MKTTINGVKIAGIASSVPANRHAIVDSNNDNTSRLELEKLIDTIGVTERRIAPENICTSDLAVQAAEKLMEQLGWAPETIDLLVFLTQGTDYPLPATACLIQNRLGLSTTTAAFDVCLGCSGYTYGLWMVSQLLAGSDGKRALFLCGDVTSHSFGNKQNAANLLFGDAATATALERDESAAPIHAVLGTDGSGGKHISIEIGGARHQWRSFIQRGNISDDALAKSEFRMNGPEVFTFTLRGVPKLVKDILAYANTTLDEIDYVVFHQANKFILEHLRKKLRIPDEKFIISMEKFGNTSSASIPLAICEAIPGKFTKPTKLLLAGFGVGWSWGGMVVEVGPIPQPSIIELAENSPTLPLYPQDSI